MIRSAGAPSVAPSVERRMGPLRGTIAVGLLEDRRTTFLGAPADALFHLCSLTKPMTAALVCVLARDGALDLDVPIEPSVHRLQTGPGWPDPTLRHLLTHAGGFDGELPDQSGLARYGNDQAAIERAVSDFGVLRRWLDPGRLWAYANTGYWLAGLIAARAAGTSFEGALQRRVFRPLEMEGAGCAVGPAAGFPQCRVPSGGVVAGVADVLSFAAAFANPPEPDRAAMIEPVIETDVRGVWQAVGWLVDRRRDTLVLRHEGSYGPASAAVAVVPDRGATIVVLAANAEDGAAPELASTALDGWVGAPRDAEAAPARRPARGWAEAFVGTYAWGDGRVMVAEQEETLEVRFEAPDGTTSEAFEAIDRHAFVARHDPRERLSFHAFEDDGRARVIRLGERLGGRDSAGADR